MAMRTLARTALLIVASLACVAARMQVEIESSSAAATTAGQTSGVHSSVNVSLSVGCPDFLASFYAANTSTPNEPFLKFTLTKGTSYAYFAVHFAKLWLPPGASVVLRSVEDFATPDTVLNVTKFLASGDLHTNRSSPALRAKELRVEVYRRDLPADVAATSEPLNPDRCFGFVIDSYMFDTIPSEPSIAPPATEAACAQDNSVEAVCYYNNYKTAYLASRAVARLLTKKSSGQSSACTGWLVGADGHILTNRHCVKDDDEAAQTTVEFMADATVCKSSCEKWGSCEGTVEAMSTTVVYTSDELDFTLLKLVQVDPTVNLPSKYGFLRLKAAQGRVGQPIYIPQHPLYYGKRIAMFDDYKLRLTVTDTNATGCESSGYSYKGDTQGGSSGSPVIDSEDHGVVALHHCGQSCRNTGVPSVQIIRELQVVNKLPSNAIDLGDQRNTENFPSFTPQEAAPPLELTSQLRLDGAIRVSADGKSVSVDQIEFSLPADADVEIDVLSVELSDSDVFRDLNGDCRAQYMDAVLYLFAKGSNAPVKIADDSDAGTGAADGSVSYRDPYLRTFLKKGTYVLALGSVPLRAADAYNGVSVEQKKPELFECSRRGSNYGAYRVTIRASAALAFARLPESISPSLLTATCAQPVRCEED